MVFIQDDYTYWHWGPDENLDSTNIPPGYANGTQYAFDLNFEFFF